MPSLFDFVLNKGLENDQSPELRRRVIIINVGTVITAGITGLFLVVNLISFILPLFVSNCILFVVMACMFLIDRIKYSENAVFAILSSLSLYYFANGVLLHNSLQYALIIQMVLAIMLLERKALRMVMFCIQVSLFVLYTYFQNRPAIVPPFPVLRSCFIVFFILLVFACMLEYFKAIQREYQNKLTHANTQLIESNHTKERMLSILSHDFNAPVANLISTLHLVDAEILSPEQFHEVSLKLKQQLQVLTTSLQDVLQWSKMQREGVTGQAVSIPLRALLEEILPLFDYALSEKKITVENNLGQNIFAFASKDHLKLIFRNLLSNAIKFSYSGGSIFISGVQAGGNVSVAIRDEGIGIQPAILNTLQSDNNRFRSSAGTANEKGTGLGLMLVREFLQKNNGLLFIESEPGKGSTFTVQLPAVSAN